MEEYFFILDNLLEDERKIITLKSFSAKFNIHVNKAIHILDEYVKNKTKINKNLSITYCICGEIISEKNDKFFQIELVSDDKLKNALAKYLPGCSHHIYSIQPCPLHSFTMLYNVDFEINKEVSKSSAINFPELELRKIPLCKIPTETLEKLSIIADKKKNFKSDIIIPDNIVNELKNDDSSKLNVDASKGKLNSKISIKNSNNMHSFFGKKLNEKSNNGDGNQTIQEKKSEIILSNYCKPSTSKFNVNEKENKLFTQVKKSGKLTNGNSQLIMDRKRKCNISSSEDDDSLSSNGDLVMNLDEANSIHFESPNKINLIEEDLKMDIHDSLKDKCENCKNDIILNCNEQEDQVDSNLNGVTRKKTLVRKTFIDGNGFMVTEKVWESEIINNDPGLSNEPPKIFTNNEIGNNIANNDVNGYKVDKIVEKIVRGNKMVTKPREKLVTVKQSMLTNFFKKN